MKLLFRDMMLMIFLTCLLPACTKNLDYTLPYEGDRISLSARIDPAEGLTAFVSRSGRPVGEEEVNRLRLTDASVRLFSEDNEVLNVPHTGDGFYRLPRLEVVTGARYRIEVAAANLDTLRSEWVLIPPPPINAVLVEEVELDTILPPEFAQFAMNSVELTFTAEDPEGENYYLVEVFHDVPNSTVLFFEYFSNFDSEFCQVFNFNGIFFPDDCFVNTGFQFRIIPQLDIFDDDSNRVPFDNYVFTVRSIDANYWEYQKDRLNLDDLRGVILEPRPSTTNVTGGYGVFLASNSFRRVLDNPN